MQLRVMYRASRIKLMAKDDLESRYVFPVSANCFMLLVNFKRQECEFVLLHLGAWLKLKLPGVWRLKLFFNES
jgi:hypothetical protein